MRRVPNLYIIAAVGNSGELGLRGALPWPPNADDMKWFREMTTGGILFAGKTTYDSIKGLDGTYGRAVLLFSRKMSIEDVTTLARDGNQGPVWICGGANIYKLFLPMASRLHVGLIDYDGPADRFFPQPWKRKATF